MVPWFIRWICLMNVKSISKVPQSGKVKKTFFNKAHFQLEARLFLFVTSWLLLFELCPIKVFCQQREQPTIKNINVILRRSYIMSTLAPRFPFHKYFTAISKICSIESYNLMKIPKLPSRIFFTLLELTGKENLRFILGSQKGSFWIL